MRRNSKKVKSSNKPAREYITEREHEILNHMLDGKNALEIAQEIKVKEKTVKYHMTNIYKVYGVSGGSARARLMAKLLEKT